MSFCSTAHILQEHEPAVYQASLRCKRWKCEECCPKNAFLLKKKAERGRPNTFITLTSNPEMGDSQEERARILKKAWVNARRYFQHQYGNKKIPFIAVFELTRNKEPHLHILCRSRWIPQDELSEKLDEYAGAPIVDISRVRNKKKIARYVAKYIGKAPAKFDGCVRYWTSRDFELEKKEEWQSPLGKPISQWIMFGTQEEVQREMERQWYEKEVLELPQGIEVWWHFKPPRLIKSANLDPQRAFDYGVSASPGASPLSEAGF